MTGVAYDGSLMSARGQEDMSRLTSRSVDEGLMIIVQYYAKYRPKATKFNTISCFFSLVYRCLVNSLNDLKKENYSRYYLTKVETLKRNSCKQNHV